LREPQPRDLQRPSTSGFAANGLKVADRLQSRLVVEILPDRRGPGRHLSALSARPTNGTRRRARAVLEAGGRRGSSPPTDPSAHLRQSRAFSNPHFHRPQQGWRDDHRRRRTVHPGAGELVAFPTETVYGPGAADATNEARGGRRSSRPRADRTSNPADLACAGRDRGQALRRVERHGRTGSPRNFWPGPLTLVLPRARGLHHRPADDCRTSAPSRSAHRAHPMALELISRLPAVRSRHHRPTAAARSARLAPSMSPESLGDRVSMILNGGALPGRRRIDGARSHHGAADPAASRWRDARGDRDGRRPQFALSDALPTGDCRAQSRPAQPREPLCARAVPVRLDATTVAADEGPAGVSAHTPCPAPG